jgi:hypothetical protein
MAKDIVERWAVVDTVIYLLVPYKMEILWTS